MDIPPLAFEWTGEEMKPLCPKLADEHFTIGERYILVEHNDRSVNSHRHYFSAIREGWLNLREDVAERFPTPEALRKYALIKAGYADSQSLVCSSKAEAQRIAAFLRPTDEFSIIVVKDATVTRWVAKSQSLRAMGKEDFQASKDAVLDVISAMVKISSDSLKAEAGQAA